MSVCTIGNPGNRKLSGRLRKQRVQGRHCCLKSGCIGAIAVVLEEGQRVEASRHPGKKLSRNTRGGVVSGGGEIERKR